MNSGVCPESRASIERITALLLIALASCGTGNATADPFAGTAVVVARTAALHHGDAVMGASPIETPIHIEVALRLRNEGALDALIADNAKRQARQSPPNLLDSASFLAKHAPTIEQARAVADYLTSRGFDHVTITPNRLLVSADGTAATAARAFMTSFSQVRTHDGRIAYANNDDARLPIRLGNDVLAVVGLQSIHEGHTFEQPLASGGLHVMAWQGHSPIDFTTVYRNFSTGNVQSIGMLSEGKIAPVRNDLTASATNQGLTPPPTSVVNTNGTSSDTAHQGEWDLDSQALLGMAAHPGEESPTLIFYNIPSLSNANQTADFNAIVAANATKVIEASVGECETDAQADGSAAADDAIFKSAVGQGQTFVVPAGNAGVGECGDGSLAPSWPASSQYVIAVGGTTLNTNGPQYLGENVWSKTGGSPSRFEPMPSWQASFGVPGTTRGVPDVAFDGNPESGALIFQNLSQTLMSGTGLSAALFAGAWHGEFGRWGSGFGYAGPTLYALPAADFHDITTGSNGGEAASAGYDFASGRGSMLVSQAIDDSGPFATPPPTVAFSGTVTGRTIHLQDQSTDPGAAFMTRSWRFGDGAESTLADPTHTYAASGVYTVVETLTNNNGGQGSKSQVFDAGAVQLLKNPGFEYRLASWTSYAGSVAINSDPAFIRSGAYSAKLHAGQSLLRSIPAMVLPSYATSAKLVVNQWITNPNGADFTFQIIATDASDHVLATFTQADVSNGYKTGTYDLKSFIGESITISFVVFTHSGGAPVIYLDDLAVNTTD